MEEPIQHLYEIQLYLNTALMQSPSKISKTQKAIEFIKHYGIVGRMQNGQQENGTHHINLILTNNNLGETKQWDCRLKNKLGHLNPMILSSRTDSDMKNLNALWGHLLTLLKPDDLPDLIVMCTNEQRIQDIVKIVQTLKHKRLDLKNIGIHRISLSIMFDEADKNMRLIVSCLEAIWPLLTMQDMKKDDTIRDFHFITATPLKEFWKEIRKCGIETLRNINQAIIAMDDNSVLHMDYKILMEQYRSLQDHAKDHSVDVMTKDPVHYAKLVLTTWNKQNPRIVFAPADIKIQSHYDMRDLFQDAGYCVFVNNGEKKGFYNAQGSFESLDVFRANNNVHGELYEVFQTWRTKNPLESLAITGYLTIIRGITFNTIGFNFTNMILSECHMRTLADLLQVAGRANGDKAYVGCFVIHCPKQLWTTVMERIHILQSLHEKNPDEFVERDFRPAKKREEQEVAWTVPSVFTLDKADFDKIQKIGKSEKGAWDTETIFPLISDKRLVEELRKRKAAGGQFQITAPVEPDTYKKYITDFKTKAAEGRRFNMGLHKDNKDKDGYQIFLDKQGYNIIVSVYNGTRLPCKNP